MGGWNAWDGWGRALGVGTILLAAPGCRGATHDRPRPEPVAQPAAKAAPPRPVPEPQREPTLAEQLAETTSLSKALALTTPLMADSANSFDDGTVAFVVWSANHLRWSDVVVSKNETSFALAAASAFAPAER